ncbi:MAG: hypothetical protein Q4B30_06760 [Coriobacteriaceae bacterium]|nr:hypothetical protein [Coriobacteriaceae bacterium]
MVIAVEYQSGRIKEFDTTSFQGQVPLPTGRAARNAMTEFDLRLDRLEQDGLVLDVFWYDLGSSTERRTLDDSPDTRGRCATLPIAPRRAGFSVQLINPEILESVSRIIVTRAGGQVQAAWRQGRGNWLILGSLFEAQKTLTYTDPTITSTNAQATRMLSYLTNACPLQDPDDLCRSFGFPPQAMREVESFEASQSDPSFSEESPTSPSSLGPAAAPQGPGDDGRPSYDVLLGDDSAPNPMEAFLGLSDEDEEDE